MHGAEGLSLSVFGYPGHTMKEVIVIGAGFAGLAAAQHLAEKAGNTIRITVLEGGDRAGGRAQTAELPGLGKAEFGAT